MKILVVCFGPLNGVGISVFYRRLICELAKTDVVDVLSDTPPSPLFVGIRDYYHLPFTKKMQGWYRRFLRWFGTTPASDYWSRKAAEVVAKDYDVVVAMMATTQLTPAVFGKYFAQKTGCKFAIYAVDAIPAPGGWTKRRSVYRGKIRIVRRVYPAADYVAASNRHMLEFQLNTFKDRALREYIGGGYCDVLFTPSPAENLTYPPSAENIFLFTGALYGLRNPRYILKAFKRLLKVYPDAQFYVVGSNKPVKAADEILNEEERLHFHTAHHTSELDPYFSRAKVLVDIDADLNKDPFLSGKMSSYIKVNRVIISETGRITPSRELFAGLETIIQCDHNEDSLYEGMLRAIEVANSNPNFAERKPLVEAFSVESVGAKLREGLARVCTRK